MQTVLKLSLVFLFSALIGFTTLLSDADARRAEASVVVDFVVAVSPACIVVRPIE
jgi:hypothetical protein